MACLAASLLCFTLLAGPAAPTKAELRGKTPTQVVQMGREAWFKHYTSHDNDSTAHMGLAEGLYGDCLKAVNDRTILQMSAKRRHAFGRFRALYGRFCDDVLLLGPQVHGWNTGWIPALAGSQADTEEGVALLMGRVRPFQSKEDSSDVLNRLEPWALGKIVEPPSDPLATYPAKDGLKPAQRFSRLGQSLQSIEKAARSVHPQGGEMIRLEATGRLLILEAMLKGGGISRPGAALRAKMRPAPKSQLR